MQRAHIKYVKFWIILVLGLAGMSFGGAPASAQFGGTLVPSTTVTITTQGIADAISDTVREVLNARPVVDREKVEGINGLAISEDAKHMATALEDGSVGLWDVSQGREVARLKGHKGAVKSVVISEKSKTAVSVGEDGQARVWNLSSGRPMAKFTSDEDKRAQSVALSGDGNLALTGHEDGIARLWEVKTGKEIRKFKASDDPVSSVVFSHDGSRLAIGDKDGGLSVWEVETGQKLFAVEAHGDPVNSVDFLPSGEQLASAGDDGEIKIWNAKTGKPSLTIKEIDGAVKSIAVSRDGKQVVSGGEDGVVRLFNTATGELIKAYKGHEDSVTYVTFGKDDKVIHTASVDGTSRIFERVRGEELAQIVSSKDGWAVFNNSGDFDGQGEAIDAVSWQTEDLSFDMDQFASSHYEPGVLAHAAVARIAEREKEKPVLSVKFATPPVIAFKKPEEETESDKRDYAVEVDAGDLGGGILEIRLYQNGKLVKTLDLKDNNEKRLTRTINVALVAGKNAFRTVALSRDRIESRPAKVTVKYTGAERRSTLHLVTIGINKYRNPALNLNYGVPDAKGLTAFFKKQPLKLFKAVKTQSLEDRAATRPAIKKLITSLTNTEPQDVVVIYYAGHGDTIGKDWYLMPSEITYPERDDHIRKVGIRSTELDKWVGEIKAQKVVMMMDACKSGAALKSFRGFEERKALSRLARTSGVHIVAAAGKDQFAAELAELGHGAFTFALLDGLSGEADKGGDGTVSVRELMSYLEERLPEISEQTTGQPQFPVINSMGQDFPFAVKL